MMLKQAQRRNEEKCSQLALKGGSGGGGALVAVPSFAWGEAPSVVTSASARPSETGTASSGSAVAFDGGDDDAMMMSTSSENIAVHVGPPA
jgi:hypothetical protein